MSSDVGMSFQRHLASAIRNSAVANSTRRVGMLDLLDDARVAGCQHALVDRRVPVFRPTEAGFGHLPPWAQPAWIRQ